MYHLWISGPSGWQYQGVFNSYDLGDMITRGQVFMCLRAG